MYSLDVNFLNDRPEIKPDKRRSSGGRKPSISSDDRRPLYLGVAALVFFPTLAAALLGILTLRNGDLEKQKADLEIQLGNLETEKKNLSKIQEDAKQATAEAESLASVFNQIKPWSAMTQDIRDRLPSTVQLASIEQKADPAAAGITPAASTTPVSGRIEIKGTANSFNDVNDFLLTLQQSNFLRADQTKVISAELGEERTLQLPEFPGVKREMGEFKPPRLPRRVSFAIATAINDVPASELIRELDRKGAVGLVTRIEALKERGVISESAPKSPTPAAKPDGAKKP
ncbi:PilN domain-containing protein [Leptolyngbya sp. NIES-2104]|uniref:PilN domain-containing protein n=1 Tax=Leptolyngbya sp. NIES-2104 TaxID=1552121 RepID=UPI0006EC88B5|nr:PilN domain-containing protein [Leptolyngbya sp. NIES-2104]GAP97532.1 type IV pilus biogenesis protein PilN [Leptolyngbya sp. NIES-2104]